MKESLNSLALQRFKKNPTSYVAVGIFCGLFLILAATLSLLDVGVFIISVPFLVLPFLFASHISCYYLEVNQPITVSSMFRYFFGFFNGQFRSSFRGIRSFLLSLAVYFGFMIVAYLVLFAVFRNLYGASFTDAFSSIVKNYTSNDTTYEDLFNELNSNEILLTFFIYTAVLPIPFAVLWFIYSISFASISIYYRANLRGAVPSLIRLAVGATYSRYGRKMRKDWFKLNWPLLVISLAGSILGALLVFLVIKDITYLSALVSIGSVTFIMFFLPFYFANMEVLYHRYEGAFKEGNKQAVELVLARIQNSIELSEDERRAIEESFKNDTKEEE